MGSRDTRKAIILAGSRLIHEKGYHHTGLQEILREAGVPKGSFYFYFKSKEDFGLQVIEAYAGFILHTASAMLGAEGVPPLTRLERFFDFFQQHFERLSLRCGCPIGNLVQEMSDQSEAFRLKLASLHDAICGLLGHCLTEAQTEGEISGGLDARETAEFIFDGWEGAVMHMKLARSAEPLATFRKILFGSVLNGPDA